MKSRILPALGLLFAVTLIGRSVALSSETADKQKTPAQTSEPVQQIKAQETATPDLHEKKTDNSAQQCVTGEVLNSVNKKLALLKQREMEIDAKQSAYKAIDKRLKKQLSIVEAARDALASDIKQRSDLAENDIVHLTTMYETMKPKQAAKIFNNMDAKFSAGFLREMKSGTAGLILANMESRKAYEISLVIASRNAKYREQADTNLP